ncbi:hypothetical protein CONPUDRAFT_137848 [Coniophora puteana RWD-64-598 SS2]|uniref:Uncharacterized protein n=1 Tax=Coniophora puteana (strain RWD-64-598) TaxID=741705 RepID=A0A5M3MLQ3_CONPW|nr:uncharacterized protein CONPUDRAFT_137848 [Coniophora puteana RWD-64-598 SS2]EIW79501.1 hypothetical protein CONPUDRAFT_137848 [Coniophora puteana RWD-64-598 SS2]
MTSLAKKSSPKKAATLRKKRRTKADEDEEDEEPELEEGQEVVGRVIQAPKDGWAPEGQISQHTFSFLSDLQKPENNDRQWFKLREPIYRRTEAEFKAFIDAFTDMLTEVDDEIPPLPPKDVIHRIYRDIRFSNDKTPYKTGFSGSFSRSGRKGKFAFFKPGDQSMLAAGSWCPAREELQTIRNNILRSPDRLRAVIARPAFVKLFGEPRPHPKGSKQNIFGAEDELKGAPKGIDKGHKDIDLLRCRSFIVSTRFSDKVVTSPDFIDELRRIAEVLMPFVRCLNDMITIQPDSDEEGGEDDEED